MPAQQTSDRPAMLDPVTPEERIVRVRPATVLAVLGLTFGFLLLLYITWISRQVLTWGSFWVSRALPPTPAVGFSKGRALRRGLATAVTFLLTIGAIVAL